MSATIMKCGCRAQGTTKIDGKDVPVCVIHLCTEVMEEQPNLEGRKAECTYCGKKKDSSADLPFFEYKPDSSTDRYYCGCIGILIKGLD